MQPSPMNFSNQSYLIELLGQFQKNPDSVDPQWRAFFQGMEFVLPKADLSSSPGSSSEESPSLRRYQLREAYRRFGHLVARSNPIYTDITEIPALELGEHETDSSLCEYITKLKSIYTGSIGYECFGSENSDMESWFYEKIERDHPFTLSDKENKSVLDNLCRAKLFEDFLHRKFLGAKRFSLEGAETFIPMLIDLFNEASLGGVQDAIIGMAHRGRLNVLCNILNKPYSLLFTEFNSDILPSASEGMGDVKYHKGYSTQKQFEGGRQMKISLVSNPSHLESVDPVMLGLVKARQCQRKEVSSFLPVMIHGDASIAGQGVVYETLQLSKLDGYAVGGTIHIIINNQIGFTAKPRETRSTRYCTDIAKAFGCPILHVNAEDMAACIYAVRLAFELKSRFNTDVFIDFLCHRLYGHNEADEPSFTSPLLYRQIKSKDHLYTSFKNNLLSLKVVDQAWVEACEKGYTAILDKDFKDATRFNEEEIPHLQSLTTEFLETSESSLFDSIATALPLEHLQKICEKITTIPADFHPHPKLKKLFEERLASLSSPLDQKVIDWATAELLAYASLLEKGIHVRLSGQDCKRGTFSHRHAVLVDQETEMTYTPFSNLGPQAASFDVYNSALSEFAVMGFEFGYSLGSPKALVIWEAQFGDFVNGAQIIIDQYLSSSETKWSRIAPLTLFLPNGMEGMGPEHSSCRIERFLQLAGLNNWRIVNPSTPAQMFHLLRRQVLTPKRKPLIVATPKNLLRFPLSFSPLAKMVSGSFEEIIDDEKSPKKARRILLCSGHIYYDILHKKEELGIDDIALIRVEELYPLHVEKLKEVLGRYRSARECIWVQEEPSNQGAWDYLRPYLREILQDKIPLKYVGRMRSSSPATGFAALHKKEQADIVLEALTDKRKE